MFPSCVLMHHCLYNNSALNVLDSHALVLKCDVLYVVIHLILHVIVGKHLVVVMAMVHLMLLKLLCLTRYVAPITSCCTCIMAHAFIINATQYCKIVSCAAKTLPNGELCVNCDSISVSLPPCACSCMYQVHCY
jgi:hypothetical protein